MIESMSAFKGYPLLDGACVTAACAHVFPRRGLTDRGSAGASFRPKYVWWYTHARTRSGEAGHVAEVRRI